LKLLKYTLQNLSLKAHYKAGNIFAGFFATWDWEVAWSFRVQTADPQVPSLTSWQSAMVT